MLIAVDFLVNGQRFAMERLSLVVFALEQSKQGQHPQIPRSVVELKFG
jgi:hypothetical protein